MLISYLKKIHSLCRLPEVAFVISFLVSIPFALFCIYLVETQVCDDKRVTVEKELYQLGMQIRDETVDSKIMGASSLMGLMHLEIKSLAQKSDSSTFDSIQSLMQVVATEFRANNAFVVDSEGVIAAYYADGKISGVGKDVSFRPYFKQAIKGMPNVYAAVGTNTQIRGLYCTAPVYAEASFSSDVVGAVVIKINFSRVDKLLKRWDGPAMLISPEGVVFSANNDKWLFAVKKALSAEQLDAVRKGKRFGNTLFMEDVQPAVLPFSIADIDTTYHGRDYAVMKTHLVMNDALGPWTLVGLQDTQVWYPPTLWLLVGGVATGLFILLGQLYSMRARYFHRCGRSSQQLLQAEKANKDQNERLSKMNAVLLNATRLREDVERIMKHDLKSPLMFVIAVPQILAENENLTEEEHQLLSNLEDAGYSMQNMIDSSLDMFKIEQGTYDLTPAEVDMVAVVDDVVLVLGALARTKSLDVQLLKGETSLDEGPICFSGEQMLCDSMMANIIRNAMEASPENGKVRITLEKDRGVRCSVHNDGVVPEEIRDRFFEKYATAGKKGGTGLGTYSARLVAEAHGGTIGFTSAEEEGTTVMVWLPEGNNCSTV